MGPRALSPADRPQLSRPAHRAASKLVSVEQSER